MGGLKKAQKRMQKRMQKKGRGLAVVERVLPTRIFTKVRELSRMALGVILLRGDSRLFAIIRVLNSGFRMAQG